MMDDGHGEPEACCEEAVEIDVVLIDGTVKQNYPILLINTVIQEKERIWTALTKQGPPCWRDLTLVIIKQNGEELVMEDTKNVEVYLDHFASGQIKFIQPELAIVAGGRVIDPTTFNASLKDQ